ncbi:MAG TPA: HD domain-containing phosphohydrolase [Chloroflexia bacterium]|nr:HD domain-containing phosphohydrolase [Chloroflexia bacterium]
MQISNNIVNVTDSTANAHAKVVTRNRISARQITSYIKSALPEGRPLPDDVWQQRHTGIVILLWLHVIGIAAFAAFTASGLLANLAEVGLVALTAILAASKFLGRKLRSVIASFGLITCSATLVHLSGGYIEFHFHFFIMVAIIALYQDWLPFLLTIWYVVLHHGVIGVINPSSVYNHPDAIANPWKWAAIHGGFVLGISAASIISWRLNEAARARTELVLSSVGEGLYGVDLRGKITFANPAATALVGWSENELNGRSIHTLLHHSNRSEGDTAYLSPRDDSYPSDDRDSPVVNTLEKGVVCQGTDGLFHRKDGTTFPADYVSTPLRQHNLIVGAVIAFKDSTERTRSEEVLRESEKSFRLMFASNPLPMWVYDLETLQFLDVNNAAVSKYGYSREEFLEMRITDIGPPEDAPRLLEKAKKERSDLEYSDHLRHRRKDGHAIDVQIVSHKLEVVGRPAMLVVAEDITERKRAEEQVKRQVRHLAALRDIDTAITASFDLRVTLKVLLDQVTTQLNVDAADVLRLNPHTQLLEYSAGCGFRSAILNRPRLRLGEGHAGRAALERRTIRISGLIDTGELFRPPLVKGEDFTTYYAVPLVAKGRVNGVLEVFNRAPIEADSGWVDFLETLAGQTAIAIDNAELFNDLQHSNVELALAYDTTLEGWSSALDLRDKETEGHTQRVTQGAMQLASAMGIGGGEMVHIRRGALLHDIGKMGIPDSILLKPGPLTDEEWEIMRKHPAYAYELLSPISFLRPALDIPYCHHEKWDGTGYPRGLKGEQIPLAARIFAVVDVWDALRSDRPYRSAWPEERVRAHIRELSGTHFDPNIVEAFLKMEM